LHVLYGPQGAIDVSIVVAEAVAGVAETVAAQTAAEADHDGGDHTIVVARVTALAPRPNQARSPLVSFNGTYGSFLCH
jgi:hypothetical protein